MKSAVETLNPTRVKLTVEVPYEELKPSIDAAYKTIGQQVQVPGFRRGKVPARIIDQRIGKGAVLQEAVNEALPEFYSKALAESGVAPLSQPEVDVTEIPLEEGQQFAFTAELDVRPTIELPDFSSLVVEVDPVTVTDEDVDANLKQLQDRFGTLVSVDRAVASGDFVSIDLTATIDGEQIDSVSGISYEVGSGNMLEGMDDALVGAKADDEKTFSAPLAGGDRAGEQADITLKVLSVKERQLPDLDDDFAQLASEFDTFDELKADVTAQTERAKKFEQGAQARDKVLAQMLETLDIAVPDSIVTAEVDNHMSSGHEDQDDVEAHRAEVEENTRQALRTQFLLDAIAEQDEVEVGQEELIEYLVMSAQQYGMDPNQFAQIMDAQGQIPAVVGEVARRKALANVLEQIQIKDTNGTAVNLSDLDIEVDGDDEDDEDGDDAPAEEAPATKAAAKKAPATKAPATKAAAEVDAEADTDAVTEAVDEAEAEGAAEPAKKAAKKAPAKKAPAKKAPAKKAPAKKAAAEVDAEADTDAVTEAVDEAEAEGAAEPAKKAAKKAPAKKAPAKKAPAKKAADKDA